MTTFVSQRGLYRYTRLIHRRGEEQHDKRRLAMLDRLREAGLTLNEDICEFRLPRLTFFGHEVTRTGEMRRR